MFINRIYLYDDKLVITFNHKDGVETITLKDIETALAEAGFGSDLVSFAVPKEQMPIRASALLVYAGRDSKGRPERREGKKVSSGHFLSPWESPSKKDCAPEGVLAFFDLPLCIRASALWLSAGRDSNGRPERNEGTKVSSGHFRSPSVSKKPLVGATIGRPQIL